MKGGILAAWLAGMGITGWRVVHVERRIPAPGVFLGITGLFLAGALVSEWLPASDKLVLAVLVGLDVAALMNVLPQGLGGQITAATTAEAGALKSPAPKSGEAGSAAGEGNLGPVLG